MCSYMADVHHSRLWLAAADYSNATQYRQQEAISLTYNNYLRIKSRQLPQEQDISLALDSDTTKE